MTQPSPPPGKPKAGAGFRLSPAVERIARDAARGISGSCAVHFGRVISGDIFVLCAAMRERLFQEHAALALDMEGAALAQAAERFGREHLVIRLLSDLAGAPYLLDEQTKLERLDTAADFVMKIIIAITEGRGPEGGAVRSV